MLDYNNPRFQDIPKFPRAYYEIDVPWCSLEDTLQHLSDRGDKVDFGGLDLDPPFQRAHVWTEAQQVAYVEYMLKGGEVGRNITFNNPTWMASYKEDTVLVDGKQRLEAVRKFMRGELKVFATDPHPGLVYSDFKDALRMTECRFRFRVCKLNSDREVLEFYLNIIAGGTPHTEEELDKVRGMLK